MTTPLVRKISTDAIVRAYESAGLCTTDPKKPADHLGFGSTMSRDALDKGSQVVVYLPFGGTFAAVVNAKTKIASGLDVLESQVYFTSDKQSERRHTLRVLDTDPLGEPAGPTPLLDCKQRSIWRKVAVRARPVRPQGRVLPDVDIAADRRAAPARQDVRRPPAGPVRRARPVRRHHAHRRQESAGTGCRSGTSPTGSSRAPTRPRTATR